jgi:hypothetical protein
VTSPVNSATATPTVAITTPAVVARVSVSTYRIAAASVVSNGRVDNASEPRLQIERRPSWPFVRCARRGEAFRQSDRQAVSVNPDLPNSQLTKFPNRGIRLVFAFWLRDCPAAWGGLIKMRVLGIVVLGVALAKCASSGVGWHRNSQSFQPR